MKTGQNTRRTRYGIRCKQFSSLWGATVESNTITQAIGGIEFDCFTGTVKSNTINVASVGIDNVPSGLISTNTYFNVPAIRSACSSAAVSKGVEVPGRLLTLDRP